MPKQFAVFPVGHPNKSLSGAEVAGKIAVVTLVPSQVIEPGPAVHFDDNKSQPHPTRLRRQHLSGHLCGEHAARFALMGFEDFDDQAR